MKQRSKRAIIHLTLAHLENENTELREQAIRLMIETQTLRDRRASRDRLHLSLGGPLAATLEAFRGHRWIRLADKPDLYSGHVSSA